METFTVSSAEFAALSQASNALAAAQAAFTKDDRATAMAHLERVRVLLPEPGLEPTRRMRLQAELGLAQMRLAAGDLAEARARANAYETLSTAWFPDDAVCRERAEKVQREIDAKDPCD